ncbi:hypothetical protein B0H16DRAFT_742963 [Mycena metata]|uniref:Major facilitator superfamily (MFS) profile domain-containing protein n=1 Tax=Mycena metata TaxID=1033252 RepID=A0AAD7DXJ8_9AGAR|nr:hypothetical protein B0H16DRAFT_742963 [Mycena metata]
MGGIWGLAASTALENLPVGLRGLASGVLRQGYAVGYLLAAVISLQLVPAVSVGWRSLFWTAAGISAFSGVLRTLLPESAVFEKARLATETHGVVSEAQKTRVFLRETGAMLKKHWLLCVYAVLLMTGFNFLLHGSQDLYPTYMHVTKGFSTHSATITTIIGNCVRWTSLLRFPSLLLLSVFAHFFRRSSHFWVGVSGRGSFHPPHGYVDPNSNWVRVPGA